MTTPQADSSAAEEPPRSGHVGLGWPETAEPHPDDHLRATAGSGLGWPMSGDGLHPVQEEEST